MKPMIEVFKTNVQYHELAEQLASMLRGQFAFSKINFDLPDYDKILRVEGEQICAQTIIKILSTHGFECEVLT
jgi:hypothetical protein